MLLENSSAASTDTVTLLAQEVVALSRSLDGHATLLFGPPTLKFGLPSALGAISILRWP
jgi:hypothetical protein